ncbi:uncharacterized protein LOC131383372 [Hylobates moloch]|uniref:uncharacterized protein LOC131383372 n=1 Tax=Hylobates moloch TaxID=81572 RepID=UPI0026762F25|nr:uncharacterized protein LOC131383372 [Hylobates moloch]
MIEQYNGLLKNGLCLHITPQSLWGWNSRLDLVLQTLNEWPRKGDEAPVDALLHWAITPIQLQIHTKDDLFQPAGTGTPAQQILEEPGAGVEDVRKSRAIKESREWEDPAPAAPAGHSKCGARGTCTHPELALAREPRVQPCERRAPTQLPFSPLPPHLPANRGSGLRPRSAQRGLPQSSGGLKDGRAPQAWPEWTPRPRRPRERARTASMLSPLNMTMCREKSVGSALPDKK